MNRRPFSVVPSDVEGDPAIATQQRADEFAPALLADSQWLDRARKRVREALKGQNATEGDALNALGIELALDAHLIAGGYQTGKGLIEARRAAAKSGEAKPQ